jgi:hypothetical protein
MILLISASRVARITGVNHWCLPGYVFSTLLLPDVHKDFRGGELSLLQLRNFAILPISCLVRVVKFPLKI